MTVKEVVENEIRRLTTVLPDLDPVKDINLYDKVLECLQTLVYLPIDDESKHIPHKIEEPYVEPTPFPSPEPSVEEYEPPVMDDKTYTKEEVRAALANGRKNGLNVVELLAEFGAENFTGLPAAKYPEIMARLGAV